MIEVAHVSFVLTRLDSVISCTFCLKKFHMMNVVDLVLHEISARKHLENVRSTNLNFALSNALDSTDVRMVFLFFATAFDHVEDHCGFSNSCSCSRSVFHFHVGPKAIEL